MRKLISTFFGIGRLPGPTGTYASAAAAALALAAFYLGIPLWGLVAAAVLVTGVGVFTGHGALEDFGAKDPREFVLDEVAGMLIAAAALWLPQSTVPWATTVVACLWFRVCDIVKPPPARQLESLPRGWGIVMDDVAAGLMALGLTVLSLLAIARMG